MKSNEYGDRQKKKQAWQEVTHLFVAETATVEEKNDMGLYI
jgi:hypothetical protein